MATFRLLFEVNTHMEEEEVKDFALECVHDFKEHLLRGETVVFLKAKRNDEWGESEGST